MPEKHLRFYFVSNKFSDMARYNDKTPVSREELAEFAKALKVVAGLVDGNVMAMQEAGIETIQATHAPTRAEAIEKLLKVCGALQTAVAEQAFQSGTQKKASPTKRPAPKEK